MQAMDAYKRANGRMFPTCSEILEVLRSLGYEKVAKPETAAAETEAAVPTTETADEPADEIAAEFDSGEDAES